MNSQPLHPHTVTINRAQQKKSKLAKTQALNWLAQTFPAAFDVKTHIRPLKIGIVDDILSYLDKHPTPTISRAKVRQALVVLTRRIDYLTCLKAQEMRVDLNGEPTTHVTAAEANSAREMIKARFEQQLLKKKAEKLSTLEPASAPESMLAKALARHTKSSSTPTKPVITIKHKPTRQFDPDAVARLKEKLGIGRDKL
ncbi:MAG TPA: activator of prop osmoprotectant transporter [Legionellales bacterium]|nr:activator of prop osmoprotectant transporter [Legionellales bacterium]HCA89906.1 activator of prop osmoprotectant transporter [Legionellales bacterium]|tara:strand:+ start:464 stop:1057 length:594 start_codon:yes stop_codon:yes gene_type:complete